MTRDELGEALLRHGADLERWPAEVAEDARRLLASDPEAAKLLGRFSAFEGELKEAVAPPPFGASEIGAVLAARDATERGAWFSPRLLLATVSASALCFALGFAVMVALAQPPEVPDPLLSLAIGQDDIGGLL